VIQLNKNIDNFLKIKNNYFHMEPFSKLVLDFFDELSKKLFKSKNIIQFPDIATFCFWCRRSNLNEIKKTLLGKDLRKGLGLLLHIPPSNVPITSIYSFAFGLLSGNGNIVRISKKNSLSLNIILKMIENLLKKKKYQLLKKNNFFITYEKNDIISNELSSIVDGRLIWGGDETIKKFKTFDTKLKCSDLYFVDKFSISIFNSNYFKNISRKKIKLLIKNFYNDTFILDQNACSSPHIIFWQGTNTDKAQKIFWDNLELYVMNNYKYTSEVFSKKYKIYNQYLFDLKNCTSKLSKHQVIYRIELSKINNSNKIENFRGFSGLFFEKKINQLDELNNIINEKIQTITYFGYKKKFLNRFIENNNLTGVDRVVPVGMALDLDFKWDGYNIMERLTRIINIT
jgi:hypothetical protein